MKHITSKLLSLLLTLAMLMSMVPAAYANDTESTGVDNNVSISEDSVNDETKTQAATGNIVTVNGTSSYATLEEAFTAAEPDEYGVITYRISGKAEVNATGWVQVAKDGLTSLKEVKFIGETGDAEICINGGLAILADQKYDIDVSFTNLKLSKPNPAYGGDYGHSTNYFTCWLRSTDAANNTVTYTNCTFPNGVCNNQYGNTVFNNCQFTNNVSGYYNLWNYGGNTEVKGSTFTGMRGIKTYNEGNLEVAPTVTVENTAFNGLTEKAAIVASKPTNITLTGISATNCAKGFFQKDIEGSSDAEKVTIAANGSGISGTFNVTAEKTAEAAKNELNITSGKLEAVAGNRLSDLNDYLADNLTISEDGTVTESPSTTAVAKIGTVEYMTLQDAINAAGFNKSIHLLTDIALSETAIIPESKNLTINLRGHNITAEGTVLLNNGKLQISSTGADKSGVIESTKNVAVAVGNNSKLTVNSGTLKGREGAVITGLSTGATIEIKFNATLIATDNAVISGNGSAREGNPNTITIKGSTFIGSIQSEGYIACGIYAPWNDNVTVSGGTFNITNGAGIVARAGTVKVTGGTFNCTGTSTGWVGDNKNLLPCTALVFDAAANYPALTNSSQILVSGGKFSTNPAANGATLADGYVATETDGTYSVGKSNPAAEIDGVKYDTLQAAINAAQATKGGATITLLKNINTESYYAVNGDNKVTIDLAGYNITGSGISGLFYVTAKGDLTIKGEGTVTAVEDNGAAMAVWVHSPIAKVTLEGGTYTQQITNISDNHFDLIYVEYGTAYIKGGTYEGATPEWTLNCNDKHYPTEAKIEVTGGTFVGFDPTNNKAEGENTNFVPAGYVSTKGVDGNFVVTEANYVAEVNGVKYKTLQAAVDAAVKNNTVKLLADTRENVTIDKAMTLDLNGYTLNGGTEKGKPALTITARTVTIKDSSAAQTGTIMREDTAENSGVSSHYVIDIQGNAWVKFESGNVKNNSGNDNGKGASLVRVGDDSVAKYPGLNIKGGTFTQGNFIVIKVDRGDLFLNGGTLNCVNSYAVENWHRATIKGGTVNGTAATWTYSGGLNSDLAISGGTVNGNVAAVSYDGAEGKLAKVKITGGTVNGTLGTYTYSNGLVPTEETAKATIEVTGGTFSSDPTKYVVENSSVTKNDDGTYGVAKAYLAQVGETSYYTMDEAFKAQTTSREPIVLLRDYTTGGTFNSGSINRTVDLNGHTWTCTGTDANSAAFEINNPNASLTVKNGKIVSSQLVGLIPSAMGGTIKYDNSSLTFENVEMSTTATSGIETNGNNTNDSVTLKNSTLNVPNGFGIYFPSSGKLTIENSTINAKTMGVQVCAGSLSITGDKTAVTVTGDAVPKTENDGAIQDGAAISIVNRTGYKELDKIEVTGGKFTAKEGNSAIKAYDWKNQTESNFTESDKVSVSGGTFSSIPTNMNDLCADGYIPVKNEDGYAVQTGTYVASIGTKNFATLADAIAAAKDGDTVTLLADTKEDVTINKNITLDLNSKMLTNTSAGKATISVTGCTVAVKNGIVIGGSKYYNIEVTKGSNANLTLEGVTATAGNTVSSMIDNWGTLTITSGTYTGGLDTVKSEEDSKLTITGGKFVSDYAPKYNVTGTILVYGETAITGGEFVQNSTSTAARVVVTGVVEGHTPSLTKVSGGKFTTKSSGAIFHWMGKATPDNFEVSGGSYSKSVSELVCADGFIPTKNADGTYGVKEGKYVAAVGKTKYETLADAIRLAAKGKTITLLADVSEDVTIGKKITLDLNGKTLTNKAGHTITVEAGASLTITGEGTVDNVTHAKAAIVNYGTVVLNGGTYTRSQENAENNKDSAGGNSYYTILNDKGGHMTINAGVTVTNVGHFSSMIRNGGDENSTKKSTLIINGGTFSGGINTVKNDEFGVLEIKGGNFSNTSQYVVMNWNEVAISGGTFEANTTAKAVLFTAKYLENRAVGELTVTGGTFKTTSDAQALIDDTYDANHVGTAAISGGSFSKQVEQKWCALGFEPKDNGNGTYGVKAAEGNAAMFDAEGKLIGYADVAAAMADEKAATVKLIANATAKVLALQNNITLDLNGYELDAQMLVGFAGTVIDSSEGEGLLKLANRDYLTLANNNSYLPLYDTVAQGYRFFSYQFKARGIAGSSADSRQFWFSIVFGSDKAYTLLKNAGHGLEIRLSLQVGTNDAMEAVVPQQAIALWVNAIKVNGGTYEADNAGFYMAVKGLSKIGDDTVTVTGIAKIKGVEVKSDGALIYPKTN